MSESHTSEILLGKNIVIIGGATGLGLSSAQAFINAGAKVVIVDRDMHNIEKAIKCLGQDNCKGYTGDARDPETASRGIHLCRDTFGSLHGLYHVAGGSGRSFGDGPLHKISDEGWLKTVELNLNTVFYSNRAAVQTFLEQGRGGCILNMGSILGSRPSPKHFSTHAYAASKAAIEGFSKSTAAYYAKDNIRVNVIAPGLVATPMAKRASSDGEILNFIQTKQPLEGGRIARAEDYDEAAVYFLSDGSRFTTGQVLQVDGGWSVSEGQYAR